MILSILLALAVQLRPTPPPPNILVIVLDDWGWTERSITPSLDPLAAQGVTFDRCYVEPVCSPARYAALTGRWPRRADIGDVVNAFNSATGASPAPAGDTMFLFEALLPTHENELVGKWHLGRLSLGNRMDLLAVNESGPFGNGVQHWHAGMPNAIAQPGQTKDGYYDWYRVEDNQILRSNHEYATDVQRDAAIEFLLQKRPNPWLLWLAWAAPHHPYDPPPGQVATGTDRGDYEQVVSYLDGAIADVLAYVNPSNTIVVVFGDNGTPDDARPTGTPTGYWKGTTYEGGVRVPLIIAGPGVKAGMVSHRLVSIVDLSPTLMEMAGSSCRGFEDGRSFANSLGPWTGTPDRTWVFAERYDVPANGSPSPDYDDTGYIEADTLWPGTQYPVRLKRRLVDVDGPGPEPLQDLIYDLKKDPFETNPWPFSGLPQAIKDRFEAYATSLPPRP